VNGDSVLDTSVLFAMIVYGLAGLLLSSLIDWLTQRLAMLRRQEYATAASDGVRSPAAGPAQPAS
jgi:hypothetical protein